MLEYQGIIIGIIAALPTIVVALIQNSDKFSKRKKESDKLLQAIDNLSTDIKQIKEELDDAKEDNAKLQKDVKRLTSAQQAVLQSIILKNCKTIQSKLKKEANLCEDKLKELIITFREYRLCGFNSQAKLYFDETIKICAAEDNDRVRDLMSHYYFDYDPSLVLQPKEDGGSK